LKTGLPDGTFSSKNPNLGNFLGACNGRGGFILQSFEIFYGHWVIFYDSFV
jgi:hypothetical protein